MPIKSACILLTFESTVASNSIGTREAIPANDGSRNRYTAHSRNDRDAEEKGLARMQLVSLNVGLPREVPWRGTTVTTGIYKQPVKSRVALRKLNLDGDRQA